MLKKKILYALIIIFSSFSFLFAFPKYINAQTCNTGDGNGDGNVDGFDYVVWWQNFNKNVQGAQNGDFNCNGYVDGFDYVIWWQNFGTVIGTPTPGDRIRVTYSESNEDFANPERGFMKQSSIWLDQSFSSSKISRKEPSDTIVWVYFRLDNYRDGPIDSNGLNVVRSTFNAAREKGFKLVFRFIYNWGPGSTPDPNQATPDAPLDLALAHISQVKPIIIENSDVIAAMQAGFVGHWGEWHSSKYMYTLESKQAILDALLSALPKDRMLQIRRPAYKQVFYQGPLSASEAFSESDRSRIGHHNDCFLSSDTDAGTYRSSAYSTKITNYCDNHPISEVQCWKDFIAQEGLFTPTGGETCNPNPPRSECSTAKQELEMLHWSFINNGYHASVLDSWKTGGCWNEVRRRLGYRLVLKEALIPQSVRPGGTLNVDVQLTNIGYAAMYNPRPVYLVLEGPNRYNILLANVEPRRWEPGRDSTISVNVNVPTNVVPGTYKLGLWLPDAASSLRNNTAYAVRFANTNVWDASTGINFLTNSIQVQAKTAVLSKTTVSKLSPIQIFGKWIISTLDNNGDGTLNLLDVSLNF